LNTGKQCRKLRSLLNGLSRAAYTAILTYLGALMGEGYVPGMIVARQTFGAGTRAGALIPLEEPTSFERPLPC
jgi:hypothetical protein